MSGGHTARGATLQYSGFRFPHLECQQVTAQALGFLPHTEETLEEFSDPSFNSAQPSYKYLENNPTNGRCHSIALLFK